MRPATPEEQAAFERVDELAREAIEAPAGQRQAAVARLRRAVGRIQDPQNLWDVPARELPAALRHRHPTAFDGVSVECPESASSQVEALQADSQTAERGI